MNSSFIGIDLNTAGHTVVVANPVSGKVQKFGKEVAHVYRKYRNLKEHLQKQGNQVKAEKITERRDRIIRDINHKISRAIIDIAVEAHAGIKLERVGGTDDLNKILDFGHRGVNTKHFRQLKEMIEYKARMEGVPVVYVDSFRTSKICSRCGELGNKNSKQKLFTCPVCGHVDHSDCNAAFNIAVR